MSEHTIQHLAGRPIRAILFDFGNTLWGETKGAAWQAFEQESDLRASALLREHVAAADLPTTDPIELGRVVRKAGNEQIERKKREEPLYEPDPILAHTEALRGLGIVVEPAVAEAVFEALRIRIPRSRLLFDDVPATLAELQQRGFALGVVTNRAYGGRIFIEDVEELGLLQYFDPSHMAISADLRIRKPNPAIFLHTLNALHIPPEEAVMVGDSLRSDVAGAQSVNIFAVWKPKPRLLAKARAALNGQAANQEANKEELFAFALREVNDKHRRDALQEIKPDLIIEHIGDLLDICRSASV